MLLTSVGLPANAIMMRHDTGSERFVARESDHPYVFPLKQEAGRKICIGTLIAPEWAITAAHCIQESGMADALRNSAAFTVQIAGSEFQVAKVVVHSLWNGSTGDLRDPAEVDLALIQLSQPASHVQPIPLYDKFDEMGQVVYFLGWGYAGTGNSLRRFNDGRLRRAQNTVAAADTQLRFHFDDPTERLSRAVALEGIPGLGDSGGPAILNAGGNNSLAGVAVGELNQGRRAGAYGAVVIYERISRHRVWIDETLQALVPMSN
jgi:secreted trypsin-like serine protease